MSVISDEMLRVLRAAQVPPPRSIMQYAADEIRLPPGGKYPGERLNMDRQPVQRLLLEELDRDHWLEVVVAAPSQSAKTFIAFDTTIAYYASEVREDVVVGVPSGDMITDKWEKEIKPIFEASPSLRRLLPTTGPGSRGGKILESVRLTNGVWLRFMTQGGKDTSKAGYTARVVITTEAAGWSSGTETSTESDPLKQMGARQRSWDWDERLTILEGTMTIKEAYPYSLREASSKSRILGSCPWCSCHVSPERKHLRGWSEAKSAEEAAKEGYFVCPECDERLNDDDRSKMVSSSVIVHEGQTVDRNGVVCGDLPASRRLWFRWSAWHNLFNSIGSLAVDEWNASQHEPSSKAWENAEKEQCQFVWAVPYEPETLDAVEVDPKKIVKRRADQLPRGILPADTTHLTIGIDLRTVEGHYYVMAGRANGMLHTPAYGTFEIRGREIDVGIAVYEALLQADIDLMQPGFAIEGGGIRKADRIYVDANWKTPAVYKAWAKLTKRSRTGTWMPVFGRGSSFMDEGKYIAPKKRGGGVIELGDRWDVRRNRKRRGWAMYVDVDEYKVLIHESLALPPDQPGAMTLHAGTDQEHRKLAQHFANEVRKEKRDPKRGIVKYFERTGDQHWFDAAVYARVGLARQGWTAAVVI